MKWFKNVHTVAELRNQYRELLKKYHPDCPNGSTEATQEINEEYDKLFHTLKDGEDKENSWKYTPENDMEFKEVLNKIIHLNVQIEIIGSWIWVFGGKEYKDYLKELGFKWAYKKKAWTWHTGYYRRHGDREISIDEIRMKYGSETVKGKTRQQAIHNMA